MHEGIDTAVLNLAEQGRVHATSCMVGGLSWSQGAPMLRDAALPIDRGLHLDLTEFPLRPGSRRSLRGLIALSLSGSLPRDGLRVEIRAQLDAFEDTLGHAPHFVDGHQHVHQLPIVRDELLAELAARYDTRRPWLRSTCQRPSATDLGTRFKSAAIETLGARAFRHTATAMGFRQNHRLLGIYDFQGGTTRYRDLLSTWLQAARHGDLLMCHPSTGRHADEALDTARQAEYAVLMSPWLTECLREHGLALAPMSEILGHALSPAGK